MTGLGQPRIFNLTIQFYVLVICVGLSVGFFSYHLYSPFTIHLPIHQLITGLSIMSFVGQLLSAPSGLPCSIKLAWACSNDSWAGFRRANGNMQGLLRPKFRTSILNIQNSSYLFVKTSFKSSPSSGSGETDYLWCMPYKMRSQKARIWDGELRLWFPKSPQYKILSQSARLRNWG